MFAIGSDHAGLELKRGIMSYLDEKGIKYKDLGTYTNESCDYVPVAREVALEVMSGECDKGILCCGTGAGMSIAANKIKGIRAVCCSDEYTARLARQHNDAQILCLGGRVIGSGTAVALAEVFITTQFEGGRHKRRIDAIETLA